MLKIPMNKVLPKLIPCTQIFLLKKTSTTNTTYFTVCIFGEYVVEEHRFGDISAN